jgi:hypothetical protein
MNFRTGVVHEKVQHFDIVPLKPGKLSKNGKGIQLEFAQYGRLLFLAGEPIDEPVSDSFCNELSC